jgi:hypothetical protein
LFFLYWGPNPIFLIWRKIAWFKWTVFLGAGLKGKPRRAWIATGLKGMGLKRKGLNVVHLSICYNTQGCIWWHCLQKVLLASGSTNFTTESFEYRQIQKWLNFSRNH